jgi:hypothetical protein
MIGISSSRPRLLDGSRAVSITKRSAEAVEAIGHRADTEFVAYASMVRYRMIRYKRGVIHEYFYHRYPLCFVYVVF